MLPMDNEGGELTDPSINNKYSLETAIGPRRMKTEEKQKVVPLFGGQNYLFIYSIPCHASKRTILKKILNSSFSLKGQCHKIICYVFIS